MNVSYGHGINSSQILVPWPLSLNAGHPHRHWYVVLGGDNIQNSRQRSYLLNIVFPLSTGLLSSLEGCFLSKNQQFYRLRHAAASQGTEEFICTPFLPALLLGQIAQIVFLQLWSEWEPSSICFTNRLKLFSSARLSGYSNTSPWNPQFSTFRFRLHSYVHLVKKPRQLTRGLTHLKVSEIAETEKENKWYKTKIEGRESLVSILLLRGLSKNQHSLLGTHKVLDHELCMNSLTS